MIHFLRGLTSIKEIYQTLKRVFHHISKHFGVRQKSSTVRRSCNTLLGVWKCDETLSQVFDRLQEEINCNVNLSCLLRSRYPCCHATLFGTQNNGSFLFTEKNIYIYKNYLFMNDGLLIPMT